MPQCSTHDIELFLSICRVVFYVKEHCELCPCDGVPRPPSDRMKPGRAEAYSGGDAIARVWQAHEMGRSGAAGLLPNLSCVVESVGG